MVGIFDSGLGGLSVLELALRTAELKNERFLYYADREHVPYGTKEQEQIIKYSINATDFLISQGAKSVIVACNTATSAAIAPLREHFKIPIIGMEPAIKPALNATKSKALLLATPVTIAGKKLDNLIALTNNADNLIKVALPKLVEFAENGEFASERLKEYLKAQLEKIGQKVDSVVLGCTHFNYFKDTILDVLEGVKFYDGNQGTINRLLNQITPEYHDVNTSTRVRYFYSSNEIKDKSELAKISMLLDRLNLMSKI
ncbi:glutamate racemase [Campylobacter sp. 19-13652]|uniref:glutamate racemase n=1 Tax=Campylobacter sp. 19-13652 TaxID=2840180 RepID=UPI001C74F49D|nr:glutamate racemase [Campylobacter sp. 19-13652]BCX79509.1 glutamate racemase 2 [Campylobacter sp. 19-13652]